MMDIKFLSDIISVTSQIERDDIEKIKQQGFKTIICNRPDAESSDQLASDALSDEAGKLGIGFDYLPVMPGHFDAQQISDFRDLLQEAAQPILAYCRTGTRSATLWALSQAGDVPTDEIITAAGHAGYDLSHLSLRLKELALDKRAHPYKARKK